MLVPFNDLSNVIHSLTIQFVIKVLPVSSKLKLFSKFNKKKKKNNSVVHISTDKYKLNLLQTY